MSHSTRCSVRRVSLLDQVRTLCAPVFSIRPATDRHLAYWLAGSYPSPPHPHLRAGYLPEPHVPGQSAPVLPVGCHHLHPPRAQEWGSLTTPIEASQPRPRAPFSARAPVENQEASYPEWRSRFVGRSCGKSRFDPLWRIKWDQIPHFGPNSNSTP